MLDDNNELMFFAIDGEIVYVLSTDERFSSILRSEPQIVRHTPELGDRPRVGDKWDGKAIIRS